MVLGHEVRPPVERPAGGEALELDVLAIFRRVSVAMVVSLTAFTAILPRLQFVCVRGHGMAEGNIYRLRYLGVVRVIRFAKLEAPGRM